MATVTTMTRATQPPELPPLVEGNTAFALQLYGKLWAADGNLVLSPYSISSALAMACAGARGETARQMEQVLHFAQCKAHLHELFSRLDAVLKAAQTDGGIELNIANSLWPQKKYEFRDEFLNLLKTHYRASFTPLDYAEEPVESDELQMLVIPYRENQLQMIILLPRRRDGIAQLESRLAPASLAAWKSKTRREEVNVAIPKFKMAGGFRLSKTLQALGLKDAFDTRADFSGMDGRPHWLYFSAVLHRAFIEVNEKGTEAAAATGIEVDTLSLSTRQPRAFRADHPFVFLIPESTTDTILFMAALDLPADPRANRHQLIGLVAAHTV